MKKQTKLVAITSAAALLAIGASMTSFAATGWQEEDGQWYYYDKDGNRVEDEWRKSGDNWYWLDSEEGGAMAIDKLIEDDDDTYYVDANGVMVKNQWVGIVNEDQDDEEDPAEYHWYYMQSNGKAYKTTTNSTKFKTINGKRYAFDEDGKMLYGWVNDSHERVDNDSWEEATYYLGSWDDGSLKTEWQKITVEDEEEDEEKDYWFNFKSNGKKRYNDKPGEKSILEATIKGKKYGFDERGVMVSQWTIATNSSVNDAIATHSNSWKYFSDPEDGARVTKGWFKVVAPEEDNDNTFITYGESEDYTFAHKDADDETERWYYADGNGELIEGKIKKIKGKYYGFRPDDDDNGKGAAMLNGLVLMKVDGEDIEHVEDDGVDADELSDLLDGKGKYPGLLEDGYTLFYFGNDEDTDGVMRTGAQTINLDGDSYNFLFSKSGGAEGKGRGVTGIDDNKYIYKAGCRIKADSDDKYQVVAVKGVKGTDINAEGVDVVKVDSSNLRNDAVKVFENDDNESVRANVTQDNGYYLVNTSGAIQKNKTAAKDGDDWFFYVDESEVKLYTNSKNLDARDDDTQENWKDLVPETAE